MFEREDLDAAVAAGVLDRRARDALVTFVAQRRAGEAEPDAERFRLLTGFNDIFVTIACGLLLAAAASLGSSVAAGLGAAAGAALAWGLAEYFTRVRRMALPSIVLLLAFVGGVFLATMAFTKPLLGEDGPSVAGVVLGNAGPPLVIAALAATLAAALHWWRFRVPITVAAGTAALVGLVASAAAAGLGITGNPLLAIMLVCGLGVFALAMQYDMADRLRVTRKTDVAFWLHLLAAPLIVHPIFALTGLLDRTPAPGGAVVVLIVYAGLTLVALAVDRRALLVSALIYVLWAIQALWAAGRGVEAGFGLTALTIGTFLVLLSAAWGRIRGALVRQLPPALAERLPVTA
ncbi:hypothetical protein [Sandaracinobacteroides saxicola]|uniref:DUF2157 domain-containing protein n=1 Tax=Sandaracinobacteroides saxicola TaxID=2759707 RepID=A0A7G5IF06_9SPHN|nr:hypothetical protein [Sandaracinobacteroides saxicola]QMW21948.1 hypothetical protein H3309_11215 [Sandaracinobacteroides saxicola]